MAGQEPRQAMASNPQGRSRDLPRGRDPPAAEGSSLDRLASPPPLRHLSRVPRFSTLLAVAKIASGRFVLHDGWAIASHIALSILLSLFPFLILVTSLASFFGTGSLADEATDIILEAWPAEVGEPIAAEVHRVLTEQRRDILTLGAAFALYFASSGVESLRVGLNRAYGIRETRAWWFTRLELIGFVIGGAFVMLGFAILVVLGPLIWRGLLSWLPKLEPLGWIVDFARFGVASVLIVAGLIVAHKLIPAGRRPWRRIFPGVVRDPRPVDLRRRPLRLLSRILSRRLRLDVWRPRDRDADARLPLHPRRDFPLWRRDQRHRHRGEEAPPAQAAHPRRAIRRGAQGAAVRRARTEIGAGNMKGVVLAGDRRVEILDFPDPTPGPGEVVLEIKASGMCGSDLKFYRAAGGAASLGFKTQRRAGDRRARALRRGGRGRRRACPRSRRGSACA